MLLVPLLVFVSCSLKRANFQLWPLQSIQAPVTRSVRCCPGVLTLSLFVAKGQMIQTPFRLFDKLTDSDFKRCVCVCVSLYDTSSQLIGAYSVGDVFLAL